MPRPKKATKPDGPNSLVASAARITARRKDRPISSGPEAWQSEAWDFYDSVGELSFATQWQANAMSQVALRLVQEMPDGSVAEVEDDDPNPMAQVALGAMRALFDGDTGQPQMMAAFGTHLSVPGETYLVGLPPDEMDGDLGRDSWRVVSNEELKETAPGAGVWELDRGDGIREKLETSDTAANPALIIRIWRPHPRRHVHATSPVRAALPVLRELYGLTKHVASTIDSRLAGAGILLVPSEMTFQTPSLDGTPPSDAEVDQFLGELTRAMMTALADPASPAARVPIVVKAPGQFLAAVQHLTFSTALDDKAHVLREEAIRRLALSLDMPPEVLLGTADVNHWGAWLISEDAIKIHVEPLAKVVTDALTSRYLWLVMTGKSRVMDPAIKRFRLEADTTKLRQRASNTTENLILHDRMVISDAALLRESRFEPGDAPEKEERKRRFMEVVARGAPSQEIQAAALSYVLGQTVVPLPATLGTTAPADEGTAAPASAPAPVPVDPSEGPRNPPIPAGVPDVQAAALLASAEVLVKWAVQRGWNKAGHRGKDRRPVATDRTAACLEGAWSDVPRVAALLGLDPTRLESALQTYTTGLLTSGAEHDPTHFTRFLNEQVLTPEPVALGAA